MMNFNPYSGFAPNGIQGVMDRARQMMQAMQDPPQTFRQMIPGLPEDISSDPNAILNWLQQNGWVSQQQIQAAQQLMQMMGGR